MRYEPVLCDFDGTVANSEPVIIAALRTACAELNVGIAAEADLRACVGPPLERSLPQVLGPEVPVGQIIETYRRHYMKVAPTTTAMMPHALDAIHACIKEGIRVGVVSYKPLPLVEAILDGIGLACLMSVVRAPDLGNAPPSKTALLEDALTSLQPFRAQPVFIGDHADDEQAANEASIDFIQYPHQSWREIQQTILDS